MERKHQCRAGVGVSPLILEKNYLPEKIMIKNFETNYSLWFFSNVDSTNGSNADKNIWTNNGRGDKRQQK